MGQFIDIETAKEFMKEAMAKISEEELQQICTDLEKKSRYFQEKLAREGIEQLSDDDLLALLGKVFAIRRKAKKMLRNTQPEELKQRIIALLYGPEAVQKRIQVFSDCFDDLEENLRYSLASELLHFTDPHKYWLWTRWIWDPKAKTGALPLVINEDYDLEASNIGESYMKVGKAMAFIHHVGEAAGFQVISQGNFGVDAYLCCVYIVYVYTVLKMRMTQEFNQVMPGLAEFSRRLLGIYSKELPQKT